MTSRQFPSARPPVKSAAGRTNEPRGGGHAFERDESTPPDFNGRLFCRCGLVGEPGDQRHPHDAPRLSERLFPPVPPEDVTDRIIGDGDAA